jgi:exopolysaccharide biosynthesis polyprenyl glycosylphosphotransferase
LTNLEAPARTASAPGAPSLASERLSWRDPLLRRMLALGDVVAAGAIVLVLEVSAGGFASIFVAAAAVPAALVLAKLVGLYDRDQRTLRHVTVDELPSIAVWSLTMTAFEVVLFLTLSSRSLGGATVLIAVAVGTGASFFCRGTMRLVWRLWTPPERTVIVGGQLAEAARHKLKLFADMHVELVEPREDLTLEELRDSPAWIAAADRVIVALDAIDKQLLGELVGVCRREKTKLSVIPPAQGMIGTAVQMNHVADLPMMEFHTWDISRSTLLLKRSLDLALGTLGLLVLAPLFVLIPLAIRLDSAGKVFFVQTRVGKDGRPFRMYKFRTMVRDAEERLGDLVSLDSLVRPMFKFTSDPRATRVGRFLRRTSLDELPQLVNVVKGDMSLVGPRPEQVELVERYDPRDRFRLLVKPGMTGPMQVFGRGNLTFEERLAIERDYIENLSLGRDLHILAMTVRAVLTGKGAF